LLHLEGFVDFFFIASDTIGVGDCIVLSNVALSNNDHIVEPKQRKFEFTDLVYAERPAANFFFSK
jgi:hypothetical protein